MNTASDLILNESPVVARTAELQRFVVNISLSKTLTRNDSMEGRPFIVAPMVMMLEGVIPGSQGPLFYPGEEIAKTPAVWNHKPIVVYHPIINGEGVSACDPEIITKQKIGVIMNTKYDEVNKRLTAEAWLEEDRMKAVDMRVETAVQNEKPMELSTGLYSDTEPTKGVWNGKEYSAIARNYKPDHLAVLPDKLGACSIADGAGFIRNEMKDMLVNEVLLSCAMVHVREQLKPYVINEASFSDIRGLLWAALRSRFGIMANTSNQPDLWVEDVYPSFVIYSYLSKLWKLNYTNTTTSVSFVGEAVEVTRVTQYITVDGASQATARQKQNRRVPWTKTQ